MSKMSMPSVRVFTVTLLIFGVTFASTTAAVNRKLPSSETETVEFGSTNKEERQFDFNRENYDPYDAQASAVAFRRYKEAQALKDGQVSSIHGATVHEDALPAASGSNSDDKAYEKKFYDPFFYFNGQNNANGNAHGQYPQYPSSSAVSASRRHGRLAHYQQTPIYAMPIRSRRNTGTTASTSTVSDGIDNNLLAEDVYFFRRDPDRNKQRLAEFEKSPYFYRESQSQSAQIQPEERQFPVSRSPPKEYFGPTRGRINDQYFSRLEQQPPRYNANFGAARPAPAYYQQYQPPQSRFGPIDHNGVDVDGPRIRDRGEFGHSHSVPRTLTAMGSGLPGVNGWAVQVGTQLRVHDDGRTRHPHRYYVKDEKPRPIGRYPSYSTGRQRK